MKSKESKKIWSESLQVMPGGVNSPVRAFKSVDGTPIIMAKGKGAYLTDEDDNEYLDFLNSWGPLILGHSDEKVTKALRKQAKKGSSFGTATKNELKLAQLIVKNISFIDSIRFVSSGTEAVMSALRLARAYTRRDKIIKFSGCYHGHSDSLLVNAGSGLLTFSGNISEASSPGVAANVAADTIVLPLDDEAVLEQAFEKYADQIAAVIIEPLPANSGLLKQRIDFLQTIAALCLKYKSLLIFDEVISGFRLGFSGFAGKYKFTPDLVTYGKIIGGGLPVGAFAGRHEIMKHLSPLGGVYQAGTLSGNPMAMKAGYTVLRKLKKKDVYQHLRKLSAHLAKSFNEQITPMLKKKSFNVDLVQEESIFWLNIHAQENGATVRQAEKIWPSASKIYKNIFWKMIQEGIYMAPSAYEVGFLSYPMTIKDINKYIKALKRALKNEKGV